MFVQSGKTARKPTHFVLNSEVNIQTFYISIQKKNSEAPISAVTWNPRKWKCRTKIARRVLVKWSKRIVSDIFLRIVDEMQLSVLSSTFSCSNPFRFEQSKSKKPRPIDIKDLVTIFINSFIWKLVRFVHVILLFVCDKTS